MDRCFALRFSAILREPIHPTAAVGPLNGVQQSTVIHRWLSHRRGRRYPVASFRGVPICTRTITAESCGWLRPRWIQQSWWWWMPPIRRLITPIITDSIMHSSRLGLPSLSLWFIFFYHHHFFYREIFLFVFPFSIFSSSLLIFFFFYILRPPARLPSVLLFYTASVISLNNYHVLMN